ncbi:hypothetical protein KKE45_00475 [Patescibacteria group bacterium]|nr:hypothetical protein [Patescibacteria group bacterium]
MLKIYKKYKNNPIFQFFCKNKFLFYLLLLNFLLRIPTFFEPNRYADEDIYLALGQGLRKGLVFYRDIHDNKPPLLYIIAAIAGSVPIFRLILLVWHSVNIYFFWLLSKKLFKSSFFFNLSTLLFTILSSIPLTEGNIANGEIFMIMPATIAVYILLTRQKDFILAGFLFAIAFLFKVPIAFDFFAILLYFIAFKPKNIKASIKTIFSPKILFMLFAFIFPILLSIVYYYLLGAGQPYVKAALMQNVGYLSSWEGASRPIYQSGLFQRLIVFIAILALLFKFRKNFHQKFLLIFLWFAGGLFGSFLSGRPYPHYLIEALPPACLLLVFLFSNKSKTADRVVIFLLFLLTTIGIFKYKFWYHQSLPYYKNFIQYVLRTKNKQEYWNFFGNHVIDNFQTAHYIKKNTNKNDKIFVWGDEPSIYAMSKRLPIGRYTVAYHIVDFNGFEQSFRQIKTYLPEYVVYCQNNNLSFPQLDSLLSNYYYINQIFGNNLLFKLR